MITSNSSVILVLISPEYSHLLCYFIRIYAFICLYSIFRTKMNKGTKKCGNGRFYMTIIEVCLICTNYDVEVYYAYTVAHSEDQNEVHQNLRRSPNCDYSVVYPVRLLWA